jgi:hypothetical protein
LRLAVVIGPRVARRPLVIAVTTGIEQ